MGGRLEGKVAIITGAANGIGAAAAARFATEGAQLLLVDHDATALAATATPLGAASMAGDVTQDDTAAAYVAEAVDRFGRLDIALLNAGIEGDIAPIPDMPLATFDRVMAVNVRGVWCGLAAAMPAMRAGGGSIVITSSTAGLRGSPMIAPYVASKHAVVGLMRTAALEGAADRIRVNCVNPGPTETRMIAAIDARIAPGVNAQRTGRIPLGRYGKAEEIAALMLFLASDESAFCTGGTYAADGGFLSGSTG